MWYLSELSPSNLAHAYLSCVALALLINDLETDQEQF